MKDYKKYLLLMVLLVLGTLLLPSLITLIGMAVSPIIGIGAFVLILFAVTVILAYKNKIGRK
ncbi:MAG: hypothetical protein Q4C55_08360 [Eubacterium sp.]|nr:hypothetical protein [Eubacterium sp.]